MKDWLIQFLLIIICINPSIHGESIKDQMYLTLSNDQISYCTRKLNLTNEIGCASDFNGNYGILYLINSTSDISQFVMTSNNHTDSQYILVIPSSLFIDESVIKPILSVSNVKGLVVIDINAPNQNVFSELSKCPNNNYNPNFTSYCSKDWNKHGSGYATKSWPFPVILAYGEAVNEILKCYHKFNAKTGSRLCALEILAQMNAVNNAEICERRNKLMGVSIIRIQPLTFCRPLNVDNHYMWLSSSNRTNLTNADKVTLIISRIDSRSMFPSASSGAQQIAVSSSLLLSSTFTAFSRLVKNNSNHTNHVLVAFLDGESYDYIGSSVLANTLQSDKGLQFESLSIKRSNIEAIWEIGHLGSLQPDSKLFLHYRTPKGELPDPYKAIFNNAIDVKVDNFPPSSLLTFIAHNFSTPMFLLSDSKDVIDEPYFSSYLDRNVVIDETVLQNYADKFTQLICLNLNTNNQSDEFEGFESELMDCFVKNASCKLFEMYINSETMKLLKALPGPIPTQSDPHFKIKIADVLWSILTTKTSEVFFNVTTYDDCNEMAKADETALTYYYQYFNGSYYCMRGPTFKQSYKDFYDLSSRRYATWMYSAVGSIQTRLFLIPSLRWQISHLIIGIVITALSVLITLIVKNVLSKYVDSLNN